MQWLCTRQQGDNQRRIAADADQYGQPNRKTQPFQFNFYIFLLIGYKESTSMLMPAPESFPYIVVLGFYGA